MIFLVLTCLYCPLPQPVLAWPRREEVTHGEAFVASCERAVRMALRLVDPPAGAHPRSLNSSLTATPGIDRHVHVVTLPPGVSHEPISESGPPPQSVFAPA